MQSNRLQHYAARSSRILLLVLFWYLSCYFLMMNWCLLAYDPIHETFVASVYYLAPNERVPGPLTVITGRSTWANWVFAPIDGPLLVAKDALYLSGIDFVSLSYVRRIWLFMLATNLMLPLFAVVMHRDQRLKTYVAQILILLLAAGWYICLVVVYDQVRVDGVGLLLEKALAVVGTAISMSALYWIARTRGYKLLVPLVVATALGTIWLLVSLPVTDPYM